MYEAPAVREMESDGIAINDLTCFVPYDDSTYVNAAYHLLNVLRQALRAATASAAAASAAASFTFQTVGSNKNNHGGGFPLPPGGVGASAGFGDKGFAHHGSRANDTGSCRGNRKKVRLRTLLGSGPALHIPPGTNCMRERPSFGRRRAGGIWLSGNRLQREHIQGPLSVFSLYLFVRCRHQSFQIWGRLGRHHRRIQREITSEWPPNAFRFGPIDTMPQTRVTDYASWCIESIPKSMHQTAEKILTLADSMGRWTVESETWVSRWQNPTHERMSQPCKTEIRSPVLFPLTQTSTPGSTRWREMNQR